MAGEKIIPEPEKQPRKQPDWADGLRQLYDSVVEEPLPDSFRDLLDKLDDSPNQGKA
ncbi:NepR family anti-sigma factor [Altererythrobacter sp.]|uniref:NepR family anti-sigma factor n=1 Tax=Altererythrobacter sp. TaxID=1872480 RepID=UPI003D03CE7C